MKAKQKLTLSVAVSLIFAFVCSLVSFNNGCNDIRSDVVRLHILANSDSEEDQAVKLAVRDALLQSGNEIFCGSFTKSNAEKLLKENVKGLEKTVNNIISENGFDYSARIALVNEYFNTRVYENFTMPAGKYTALKIVLGKGEGHNWWCVMFPPLCLPAATETVDEFEFSDGELKIMESKPEYEIRFAFVELIESLKIRFLKR